jgi:S-adenosylmethionine:tRNA ribosyltransferase-isomerase
VGHRGEEPIYSCLIKSSAKKKLEDAFVIDGPDGDVLASLVAMGEDGTFEVALACPLQELLESNGKVPIPPYIRKGESDERDLKDYQTLYAGKKSEEVGSVAAPTAGLHFTQRVFESLSHKGITKNEVTLHVGLGTFRPVKAESIRDHQMHEENYWVGADHWQQILEAKYRVAVGTTSLRVLESLWPEKESYKGGEMRSTSIFSTPVYRCNLLMLSSPIFTYLKVLFLCWSLHLLVARKLLRFTEKPLKSAIVSFLMVMPC